MDLQIRPFDIAFLDEVSEIENISFSVPWSKNSFEDCLKNRLIDFFVAALPNDMCEARVAGYIVILTVAPECEILNVAVSPEFRRMGIAEKLLRYVSDRAAEKNCDTLMLEVRESNAAARALYEKIGFYPVGRRKGYYSNPVEDAILMDKSLV
ncbi:MAG: ribosomal-protein-alanine N-acetyltransferase [Ruminococcaceae bacterium]|nr:ribosomal-protein-alanine N-acetyltransferase [Oscillospiraceae bacterium]